MGRFKDLQVWQKSKDLAVTVYQITDGGKFRVDFGLRDQIRRSASSISSNIAEGDELDTTFNPYGISISPRDPPPKSYPKPWLPVKSAT